MAALELRVFDEGPIGGPVRHIESLGHQIAQVLGMNFCVLTSGVESHGLLIHHQPAFLGDIRFSFLYAGFLPRFVSGCPAPRPGPSGHPNSGDSLPISIPN
jgi:hypothetical protein